MTETLFGPDVIPRDPEPDPAAPYRIALRDLLEAFNAPPYKNNWCERLSAAKARAEMTLLTGER